ncbi:uncharacterized protein LOC142586964 [Dermacentor variabilis]|uniref:uncharacterized protein LOC142586964 n=1 Tax=Dermacentor variabilis TaxID=34621 RepID=UPI003F5AF1F6
MTFRYLCLAVACTALSSSVANTFPGSACDFTGMDVEGAIARLIAKLPDVVVIGPEEYYPVFAGLEIRAFNASGFRKLQQYGPAIPYCVNDTRKVQVEFINTGGVILATPWRHCSGLEGTFSLRSTLSRFTMQFHIGLSERDNDIKLSYRGSAVPLTTENIEINVDGAGPSARTVARILAMVFPGVTRELWNEQFFYPLSQAFDEAFI